MAEEISDKVTSKSIGRAMASDEKRVFWTHKLDIIDPSEAASVAQAQRLESKGYSLTTGNCYGSDSDGTGDIVTPNGRVLTSSEIKKLSKQRPYNPKDKLSILIHDAVMYELLAA